MAMNMDAMLKITASVAGENNIRRLGNSMQGLEGKIKNASLATNLLYSGLKGLAAGLVTGGIVAVAKSAIDLADNMRDMSQRTGVGIETLGRFKVAADMSGTSLEGVANGLKFLNKNLVAAATGGEGAAAAFKTIGVATTDVDGTLRKADKVFLDVADRFAAMRDGPEKAALAMKIFGKAGTDLIPILNLGSKEIQRFGLGIGPDFANKADAFNDSLALMKAQTTVLTVQIGSALLPVLSGLVTVVAQGVTFVGNLAAEFYKAIGGAAGLQQIAAGLIKTMVVLGSVTAGVFIATNVTTFATALGGVLNVLRPMVILQRTLLAIETARASVLGVIAALQTPGPAQTKAIAAVAAGTLGTFALVAGVGKMIDDITKQIGDGLGKALQMPNIPTPPPGITPDITGLRTGGAKGKKPEEMTERMYQAQLRLNDAEREGNTIKAAFIKFEIAGIQYEEAKVKTRDEALKLVNAETALVKELGDAAADTGREIAKAFLERQELQDNYNRTIEDLQIKAGLITGDKLKQLEIDREVAAIIEKLPGLTQAQIDKIRELVEQTKALKKVDFGNNFRQQLQDAYKAATDLGTQLGSFVASGIDRLTNAIVDFATTGKASFQDFAATALKELGAIFIKAALFKALFAAFPGLSIGMGATGGATGSKSSAPLKKFAAGGIMSSNGIVPLRRYASGGITKSPQVAIYGERGPEAYVPLPDGRNIPVKLQQRSDALNRYRPMGATGTLASDSEMAAAAGSTTPSGTAINVRYTVERINSVDYVTADQFQQGMQQAAQQGAAQGEQRTLRRLQMSTSTRKRLGM